MLIGIGIIVVSLVIFGSLNILQIPIYTSDFQKRVNLQNEKVRISCEDEGGEVYRLSEYGLSCYFSTTDGGKSCTDSNQCEGNCNPIIFSINSTDSGTLYCEHPTQRYGMSCSDGTGICADDT